MRIGILGGAFDPIHYGHLVLATEAVHRLALDRVLFIPTYVTAHHHKSIKTPFADRCKMVRLAISGREFFELSEVEKELGGVSYTVETLKQLHRVHPDSELYFLIGADNLETLDNWRKPEELVELATLAVARRPGYEGTLPAMDNVVEFEMPLIGISASDIRKREAEGIPFSFLTTPEVEEYIKNKGLYRE